MAKQKKTKAKTIKDVGSRTEIKRLWKTIPVAEWLALFQELAPENRWEMEGLGSIKGCCPYHEDGNPSFHLSFTRSMGKCFGDVCEKVVVDIVGFVAKLRRCNYTEALIFLNDRFNLSDKLLANADELNQYNNIQELKKQVAMAGNKILIDVYRDNPDNLAYCRPALTYLIGARKLPVEILHLLPVGVFAKPNHMKKYIDGQYHDAFDTYFKKYQSMAFWGGLLFYYNDSPGSITRFKVRLRNMEACDHGPSQEVLDAMDAVAKRGLYKREFAYVEDPYTSQLGVFGLYKYQRMVGRSDANAYLTEGEFDALSVMAAQDMNMTSEFMILGTGGKGGTNIGFLREFGVRTAWLVQDHPSKNGDDWSLSLLADKGNFTADEQYRPLEMKIFQWPPFVSGRDLDEAVIANGYDQMVDCLVRKRNDFFLNSVPWIIKKCDAELHGIKTEFNNEINNLDIADADKNIKRENLLDDKNRKTREVLLKWFRYMHDSSERLGFTQKFAAQEGVDIAQLHEIFEQTYGLTTYQGVAAAISEALNEHFAMGYYDGRGSGLKMVIWAKKAGELVELMPDMNKMLDHLALYLKKPAIAWLDELLGYNEVYLSGTEGLDELKLMKAKQNNALALLRYTLQTMYPQMLQRQRLESHDQGIHYRDLPAEIKSANIMYFVNGEKVFKGRWTEPAHMEWERIHSMVDSADECGVIFTGLSYGDRWSHVTDVADLYAGNQTDITKLYADVKTILDGWKFDHHDIISRYMACYIMSLPIMCAVGDINITLITGDKESGKTSLSAGLLGGTNTGGANNITPILESAFAMNNATPAAMYQTFDSTTMTLVLDEFEALTGDKRNDENNRALARLTYGMPMGKVTLGRGGITKDGRVQYKMRMPIIMAAINIPTDSAFLSRVMVISTVKEQKREDISTYISKHFTLNQLEDIRKALTVSLLPHIPNIIKISQRLTRVLPDVGKKVAHISNRFIHSLLTPLAIYELLGFNAEELYVEILKRYKNRLESIHGQDAQNGLIDECLYKRAVKVATDETISDFVSAKSLIESGEHNLLNANNCGVYYIEEEGWIVIVWRQIKYTLLHNTMYERMEESALKEQVAKNPFVYQEVTNEMHEHIQYYLRLSDISGAASYSLISSDYLIKNNFKKDRQSNRKPAEPVYDKWDDAPIEDYRF